MLTRIEKKEMRQDALSEQRRADFQKADRLLRLAPSRGVDEYIRFLMDVQKVFSPFVPSRQKTKTEFNKL